MHLAPEMIGKGGIDPLYTVPRTAARYRLRAFDIVTRREGRSNPKEQAGDALTVAEAAKFLRIGRNALYDAIEGEVVYAAVVLAGEAGLRVGEVKGLRWREDVDLVARTITVNQQIRRGVAGTPKGR